ncbi:molybdopterin-dependent oxidoreductase [Streptomyces sp. NPDC047108]|uniref:molybdopterin-dependent oxidoreductase n=1 Tax=Streptomyces sp. NPDC047108 TaxID=3155025 RepID=UPI0033DFBBF3
MAELASAAVRPEAGPVIAVGGAAIDLAPPALKDYAVRTFGTQDKLVLQLGILAVLAGFALALGILALRQRRAASAGVLVFGVVGTVAALTRPFAGVLDAVPSVVGALAGAGVLYVLAGRLRTSGGREGAASGEGGGEAGGRGGTDDGGARGDGEAADGGGATDGKETPGVLGPPDGTETPDSAVARPAPEPRRFDRRGFVIAASAVAAASAGAGALGRKLNSSSGAAVASRTNARLPAPGSPASAVPRGADFRRPGLSPFITPNREFYRVDTALVVPRIDATRWQLRIHGTGVRRPLTLGYRDLLRRELIERDVTLTCVSNQVGGPYVGNARWIGVPLAPLLEEAGVEPPSRGGRADQIVSRSVDGMTIGTPVEAVMDGRDAMLALGMNGEPLPFAHGFPLRMVVPGLYGYVSACKWLRELELTTFDAYDVYWVQRKWAREAPVKTASRIDTPGSFARLKSGTVAVAGVAWAQHRGIDRVEVRVDGGRWHTARLADEAGVDTWRQWLWEWEATPGSHRLEVRATDRSGAPQTGKRAGTVPDGATGWHSVVVTVE